MEDNKIPYHVAIIMDGNGRWAKERGKVRSYGHEMGAKTLKELALYAFSKGVKVLSVFAFSTENFKRSEEEVGFLMNLFIKLFNTEFKIFNEKDIKVVFSKKENGLPSKVEEAIKRIENDTKNNKSGIFNICINYGGRSEIVDACKKITNKVLNNEISVEDINEEVFSDNLYNKLPDIDLLIRTSGEYRISNFMMWQLSYSEMYFTDTYFPDFKPSELDKAFINYSKRDRRYGGINNEKKSC
jgi:undecaprenyl diphosphate synthase